MTERPKVLENRAVELEGSSLDAILESRGQMQRFLVPSSLNFKGQPTITSYITVASFTTISATSVTTEPITFLSGSCVPKCLADLPPCPAALAP